MRGMSYEQANQAYADAHMAGTLSDADYVEWLVGRFFLVHIQRATWLSCLLHVPLRDIPL